jgi:hypothetical protein
MSQVRKREWYPAYAADEWMPPGRPDPSAFIFEKGGEIFIGYCDDDRDASDNDRDCVNRKVMPGDIVQFLCCDQLGSVDVVINEDGTSHVVDGVIPENVTHFMAAGDIDSLSDSMEEFAKNAHAWARSADETFPYRETCSMARWSDELPHKLIHTADGWRFEPVTAAEARQ